MRNNSLRQQVIWHNRQQAQLHRKIQRIAPPELPLSHPLPPPQTLSNPHPELQWLEKMVSQFHNYREGLTPTHQDPPRQEEPARGVKEQSQPKARVQSEERGSSMKKIRFEIVNKENKAPPKKGSSAAKSSEKGKPKVSKKSGKQPLAQKEGEKEGGSVQKKVEVEEMKTDPFAQVDSEMDALWRRDSSQTKNDSQIQHKKSIGKIVRNLDRLSQTCIEPGLADPTNECGKQKKGLEKEERGLLIRRESASLGEQKRKGKVEKVFIKLETEKLSEYLVESEVKEQETIIETEQLEKYCATRRAELTAELNSDSKASSAIAQERSKSEQRKLNKLVQMIKPKRLFESYLKPRQEGKESLTAASSNIEDNSTTTTNNTNQIKLKRVYPYVPDTHSYKAEKLFTLQSAESDREEQLPTFKLIEPPKPQQDKPTARVERAETALEKQQQSQLERDMQRELKMQQEWEMRHEEGAMQREKEAQPWEREQKKLVYQEEELSLRVRDQNRVNAAERPHKDSVLSSIEPSHHQFHLKEVLSQSIELFPLPHSHSLSTPQEQQLFPEPSSFVLVDQSHASSTSAPMAASIQDAPSPQDHSSELRLLFGFLDENKRGFLTDTNCGAEKLPEELKLLFSFMLNQIRGRKKFYSEERFVEEGQQVLRIKDEVYAGHQKGIISDILRQNIALLQKKHPLHFARTTTSHQQSQLPSANPSATPSKRPSLQPQPSPVLAKITVQQAQQQSSLNQQHTRRISSSGHSSKQREADQDDKRQQRQRERDLQKQESVEGKEGEEGRKEGKVESGEVGGYVEPEVAMERKYGLRSQGEGKQRAEFIAKRTRSYLQSLEKRPR